MNKSLFTILSTYQPTECLTPEENYSTELLVYLLKYSLRNNTNLFSIFGDKILGEKFNISEYDNVKVETQRHFPCESGGKSAFPDITIETKDWYCFIEVKVESDLNYYENHDSTTINQIQKYQSINTDSSKRKCIYLLTKYPNDRSFGDCKKILWNDIHRALSSSYKSINPNEQFLIDEIIKYMEDKKMSFQKVTYELVNGIEMVKNLIAQIDNALSSIQKEVSGSHRWMGFYIKRNNENVGWVGIYFNDASLRFEHSDPRVRALLKDNNDYRESDNKKHHDSYFNFEKERFFCLNADEQFDAIKRWIDINMHI